MFSNRYKMLDLESLKKLRPPRLEINWSFRVNLLHSAFMLKRLVICLKGIEALG